jgi:hypothetical protein
LAAQEKKMTAQKKKLAAQRIFNGCAGKKFGCAAILGCFII